jgi:hypothetical protein
MRPVAARFKFESKIPDFEPGKAIRILFVGRGRRMRKREFRKGQME